MKYSFIYSTPRETILRSFRYRCSGMSDPEVGKRIRLARQRLVLSQAEFAQKIGRKKLSVIRYESGRIPRADVLDRIARLASVTVTWLLHGAERAVAFQHERPCPRSPEGGQVNELGAERRAGPFASPPSLPLKYRKRYRARLEELTVRFRRELDEYRRLLQLEYRSQRSRRRKRP